MDTTVTTTPTIAPPEPRPAKPTHEPQEPAPIERPAPGTVPNLPPVPPPCMPDPDTC